MTKQRNSESLPILLARIHAVLAASALCAGVAVAQSPAQPAPETAPAEAKPGFFRQLGDSFKDAGQRAVGVKPQRSGDRASRGGAGADRTVYTPLTGPGRLKGLYAAQDHRQAQLGRLDWPRVALTFTEWGASLPCWTVEARIWTSAAASTVETFKACADAPLRVADDLGDQVELTDNARAAATTDLMVGLRVKPGKPSTGEQRTAGPNPPTVPFNVRAGREGVAWQARKVALSAAWAAGFFKAEDLRPGPSGILTPFRDSRMWIAGFKPEGNRDGR